MGIDLFWKYFPEKPWHYFHDVLEFKWYKEFDYEEWRDRIYLELKMASLDGQDIVVLKLMDASGEGICRLNGYISGLDIINLRYESAWVETQYELIDFEESNIHFYCNEIEIKVIAVGGKNVEFQ